MAALQCRRCGYQYGSQCFPFAGGQLGDFTALHSVCGNDLGIEEGETGHSFDNLYDETVEQR